MYFVTLLTVRSWLGLIFPCLVRWRLRGRSKGQKCLVFEASWLGWWIAKSTAWLVGVELEMFQYRLADIHLPDGELAWFRVRYQDLAEVQRAVLQRWIPCLLSEMQGGDPRQEMFIRKQIGAELYRPVMMTRVAMWKAQSEAVSEPVIFIPLKQGAPEVARFGRAGGAHVVTTTAWWINVDIGALFWRLCKAAPRRALRMTRRWVASLRRPGFRNDSVRGEQVGVGVDPRNCILNVTSRAQAKLGVTYVGRFNLDDPGKYSDLFFWQCSHLSAEDIILMFGHHQDPLDEEKLAQLEKHGLGAVVLNGSATSTPLAPVLPLPARLRSVKLSISLARGSEARWLIQQKINYRGMVQYHLDLFNATGVRMFAAYHKWDGKHAAIAEALKQLGGILALYQRSFEPSSAAEYAVVTDIFFGWSRFGAAVERQSGSMIRYHVITGYVGDHRKSYVVRRAQLLRDQLMNHGARRILAFFDNNSNDDARWDTGHEHFQADYEFFLHRLLEDPSLGVIFKPQTPVTVRKRLGVIAEMLVRAEMTGRCILLGSGPMQSTTAPIEAGLAADVSVGDLWAGTPSLECALGGVRSLLIDTNGFPRQPLYRLGLGKVVFQDWDTLWRACQEHWRSPGGVPGFGDWSPMLDELDPFRDGRAAERMGNYLKWLIDGLKAGLDRETVMAEAAERYCGQWGRDKVTEVNGQLWSFSSSDSDGGQPVAGLLEGDTSKTPAVVSLD